MKDQQLFAEIEIKGEQIARVPINSENGGFQDGAYFIYEKYGMSLHNEFESIVYHMVSDGMKAGDTITGESNDGLKYKIKIVSEETMKTQWINKIETEQTGGHVYCDYIYLNNGQVIVIGIDSMSLYSSKQALEDGAPELNHINFYDENYEN